MSLRRMTETEVHDGCNRQMSPRPKDGGKVCVCLCVSACVFYCLSVCLSVGGLVGLFSTVMLCILCLSI